MPLVEQVLRGILPPLAVAVPLLLLGWWRRAGTCCRGAVVPLALGGGFAAALAVLEQLPLVPRTATQWLAYGVGTGALVAAADAIRRWPRLAWFGALSAVASATSTLLVWRLLGGWTPAHSAAALAGGTGVVLLLAAGTAPAASPRCRLLPPLLLTIACGGGAQVLAASGSALLGQLGGALAAVLGACTVAAVRNPAFALGRGGTAVLALALGGLLCDAYHFAEADPLPLLLVAAACSTLWLERSLARTPAWLRWAVVLGATVALLALAGGVATAGSSAYGY